MNKNSFFITVLGLVGGFIIGFWITNNFFYERNPGRPAANSSAGPANPANPNADPRATTLSPEEIKTFIATADAKPTDIELQKKVGFSLYQYASSQQDLSLLPEVRRLLERASAGAPTDADLMVALGNVNFDIAQNSDPASFKKAREYYTKALALKPKDINVITDLGLTYYFDQPSDPVRAVVEYRKSLAIDPKHELTLQNMFFALMATGAVEEASQIMATLESVNPSNQSLPNMKTQLAQKKNAGN